MELIYELAETNNVVKSEDIVNLAEEKGILQILLERYAYSEISGTFILI